MGRTLTWAVALVLAATAAGCSSGIDEDAWRTDLEAVGAKNPELSKIELVTRTLCDADDAALRRHLEAIAASGQTGRELTRINFTYVCPDERDRLERVIAQVSGG